MELQQPPMPTIQSQPSSQVGYTQRPMNTRSQTYNRYLDTTNFYGSVTVLANDSAYIPTNGQYISVSGQLWWKIWSSWEIIFQKQGTYMIQWYLFVDTTASTVVNVLGVQLEETTATAINFVFYQNYTYLTLNDSYVQFNVTENFARWDILRIIGFNDDSNNLSFDSSFDIISLS